MCPRSSIAIADHVFHAHDIHVVHCGFDGHIVVQANGDDIIYGSMTGNRKYLHRCFRIGYGELAGGGIYVSNQVCDLGLHRVGGTKFQIGGNCPLVCPGSYIHGSY